MTGFLNDSEIEIPCEKCGHKTKKTIGWIKSNSHFVCVCGTRITLDASQFKREIGKAERSFSDLERALKDFNKH